jgi:hypothetical protein
MKMAYIKINSMLIHAKSWGMEAANNRRLYFLCINVVSVLAGAVAASHYSWQIETSEQRWYESDQVDIPPAVKH